MRAAGGKAKRPRQRRSMKVRATALADSESNAIGSVELECTPAGLSIGLYGVGAYQPDYAPGALTHGTRFCVPYPDIERAVVAEDQLILAIRTPGFPYQRLTLSRWTSGPGVPLLELRRRRLLLHFGALSLAVIATIAASVLAPAAETASFAWGALGYGALAALAVLGLGYSLDARLFLRAPSEQATQEGFVLDLARFVPALGPGAKNPPRPRKLELPQLSGWMPRTTAAIGIGLAATVLTALVSGQRLLSREDTRAASRAVRQELPVDAAGRAAPPPPPPVADAGTPPLDASSNTSAPTDTSSPSQDEVKVERRCICDRADSPLWTQPIPKLSALLLERRVVPRKSYLRLRVEIAVVNNSDTPMSDITLHVQFSEPDSRGKPRHTRERPLYFEGPLRPGQAIKWSAEARGTEFELATPDFGTLGPDGQGSAPAGAFAELLHANHRPVRLHGARMLSYLGDPRGRTGALELKDAMRAAEGPYIRRILAATADLRVCDVSLSGDGTVGACVYNSSDEAEENVGVKLSVLSGSLDTSHPLSHPPELLAETKWHLPGALDVQAGQYVRVPLPPGALAEPGQSIELTTDRFDLLD